MSDDISQHEVFMLASSIAFTTALALAPFMLILLFVASLLGPEIQEKLFTEISEAMGPKAGKTVLDIVHSTQNKPTLAGLSGIGGFLVLVLSASAIFTQLRHALDKINDVKLSAQKSGWPAFVRERLLSFGLVFGFIFLSIVSLMISTLITAFFPGGDGFLWQSIFFAFNFVMFAVLFMMLYRFVPSRRYEWKKARISGLVSAAFYIIGKALIGLYLGHASFASSYGAAGSFVIFLAWVYYTSLILLISCEFTNNFLLYTRRWRFGSTTA